MNELRPAADAKRTAPETISEDGSAQDLPGETGTETMNKMNKSQFDQILKRRNYKRGLLKCVDTMAQKKVFLFTHHPHALRVCD